jgi:HD-like signal output (HDOD) protein
VTLIGRHETLRRIEEFEGMPSIPQIIVRVREISENPRSSVADLANIILSDHSLTSKILKIANSAFYAEYASHVSTITQAITLMGFRTVQNVVISLALFDAMGKYAHHKFDFRRFWSHSLSTGVIGKLLATASHYKTPEEAFIAGFMHNIGVPILAVVFPEEYDIVLKKMERGEEQIAAEKSVFAIDHCEVGGWLARRWNLPPLLAKPIMEHHRRGLPSRQKSNNPLVDFIYLSDMAYEVIFQGDEERKRQLCKSAYDLAAVSEQLVSKIIEIAPGVIKEIASELQISLESPGTTRTEHAGRKLDFESAELAQKLNERSRELAIIQEAGEAIRQAGSEDEIFQTTLEEVFRGMGIGRALLLKVDRAANAAHGILGFGVNSQQAVYDMTFPLGGGVIGRTVAECAVQNILDSSSELYKDAILEPERELIGCCAFATLPMMIAESVEIVMVINNPDPSEPIDDNRLLSISSLISQAAIAIERLRLKKQVQELQGNQVTSLLSTVFK